MADPEHDFLASLRTAPDDATRQVYADWLEDRGDERGEYLRVELAMASESPFVPRYWELKERRNELRAATDPAWLEAVGYPTYYTPMFGTIPDDRLARWRMVDRFIDFWRDEPLTAASGNTEDEITQREAELGVTFPAALREWYRLAGRRLENWSWSGYGFVRGLEEIEPIDDGSVPIGGCSYSDDRYGLLYPDLALRDPAVFHLAAERDEESCSVSMYAIQTLLYEHINDALLGRFIDPAEGLRKAFGRALNSTRIPTYMSAAQFSFYEGRDLLVMTSPNGFAYIAARDTVALDSADDVMGRWKTR